MRKSKAVCAVLCAVCVAALFYLHFAVYGGMLLDSPLVIGVWSVVWLLSAAGLSNLTLESIFHFGNGIDWRLFQLLLCVALCLLPYNLLTEPYIADNWIETVWILMIVLLYRFKKLDEPQAYTVLSVMALAAVALFVLFMHPLTALDAQNLVEQAGYTDLYRFQSVDWDAARFAQVINNDTEIIGCTMPEEKEPLGWYGFRAFKDGERYCVVVSAARGQIEVQEKQGE